MDNSPFKRLSPKLRNEIYERALIHNEEIEIAKSWIGTIITTNKKRAASLLQVCRLFRDEASGIFYSSNHFRFHDQASPYFSASGASDVADTVSKFVSKIGERNAQYLHHLTAQMSISFMSTGDEFATFEATRNQLRQLHQMHRGLCNESFVCDVRMSQLFMGHEATHTFRLDLLDFETSRLAALELVRLVGFDFNFQRAFLKLNCRRLLEICTEDGLGEMAVDEVE